MGKRRASVIIYSMAFDVVVVVVCPNRFLIKRCVNNSEAYIFCNVSNVGNLCCFGALIL